jgi:hypothetical protein
MPYPPGNGGNGMLLILLLKRDLLVIRLGR